MADTPRLTSEQQVQEDEYAFPYHYLSLTDPTQGIRYLSGLRIICELLKPYAGQKILDAGCGDGRLCYELRNENLKLTGVDYSERAIQFAKAFCPQATFFAMDLDRLSLGDKFDFVVFTEVLEHVLPERAHGVLETLAAVLEHDGKLIITVPSVNIAKSAKHYRHFTPESLAETLSPHFRIESLTGHLKTGISKNLYVLLSFFGKTLAPYRKSLPGLVNSYVTMLKWFMRTRFEKCEPGRASKLIALCRKQDR